MTCIDESKLQMLADNQLSQEEQSNIVGHLKDCERCRTRYEEIVQVIAFLESDTELDVVDNPPSAVSMVMSRIRNLEAPRHKRVELVLAALMIIVFSILLTRLNSSSLGVLIDTLEYDLYSTGAPSIQAIMIYGVMLIFALDALLYHFLSKMKKGGRRKN